MENNIQPEVTHFLDQYYNNPQVQANTFLEAVREKINQITDPELQEKFIFGIIEKGKMIRDNIEQHIREHEIYKLKGDEF